MPPVPDNQTTPPTTPQAQPAAPVAPLAPAAPAAPVAPAAPIAPQTPPTGATPPPAPPAAPKSSKSKLGIIIVVVVAVLLMLGGGGYYLLTMRSKQPATQQEAATADSATPVNTAATDLSCGVKISEYPTNPGKAYVQPDNWPVGFNMHDVGDEDSIREYCQGQKLKARAEEFVAALSDNDWAKAYSYLAKATTTTPAATFANNWTAEYGAYNFPPSNYPLDSDKGEITYAIEPCLKSYAAGWSKNMKNGFYKTPYLNLDNVKKVTTKISLAMTLEDGVWKVVGDNNDLHNTTGIISGDAYADAQNDRSTASFYDCQ